MDSDEDMHTLESDDDIFDNGSALDRYQNECKSGDAFSKCFLHRYNASPVFFIGSLQSACDSAFYTTDYRPVLVYIHHDQSMFSNIFCLNTFCSEIIIDYLLENYIIWPWDNTHKSNRDRLINIWKKILPTKIFDNDSIKQYPMLIGITQESPDENDWLTSFEYKCTLLLQGDMLIRTKERSNIETVINELATFKDQSDNNREDYILQCHLNLNR